MKKLIPIASMLLLAIFLFVPKASAAYSGPGSEIIQKLVDRFKLNKTDVETVFDEQKTEMKKQMQARHEERLDTLVAEGKLTEAQKKLLVAKWSEMQAKHEQERTEFEAWAKVNGIDLSVVGRFGHKMGRHMGGRW